MIDGWRPHDLAKFSETFADHWYNYNENWAANEKGTIPKIYFFCYNFQQSLLKDKKILDLKLLQSKRKKFEFW